MRPLYTLAFAGVLLFIVWVYGVAMTGMEHPTRYEPRHAGRTLSVQTLAPGEKIVIVVHEMWGEPGVDRQYQIEGGQPRRIAVRPVDLTQPPAAARAHEPLIGNLHDEEAFGLDAWLLFLRHHGGHMVGTHGNSEIVAGYYRAGAKIGEERFRISHTLFSDVRWEKGKIVRRPDSPGVHDFPAEVFRQIVPPTAIEQRLREPPQTPADLER